MSVTSTSDTSGLTVGDVTLTSGLVVTLRADDGLYLSRINRGATNPIEAAKKEVDMFCLFAVHP